MSQIRNGVFAALAVSATLGAAQLASGHDLIGRRQVAATVPEEGVNRAAKANRDVAKVAPGQVRTIALRFKELTDTSVLVRVPVAKEEARPPGGAGEVREIEKRGGLRTAGQRFDRSRETA